MTDRTLLRGDDQPAWMPGYGTVPAGWARGLVDAATTVDTGAKGGAKVRHTVETVTPTGHRYRSTAPSPPGTPDRCPPDTGLREPAAACVGPDASGLTTGSAFAGRAVDAARPGSGGGLPR